MDSDTIRMLEVSEEDLRNCDTGNLERVFGGLERRGPAYVQQLRAKTVLLFPSLDSDERPNYLIPECRRYLRRLYDNKPHFMYYLVPDNRMGAIAMHLLALAPMDVARALYDGSGAQPTPTQFAQIAAPPVAAAARFARFHGGAEKDVLAGISGNFPPEVWEMVLADVADA